MPILEASESEAVLSLDLSQIDPLHGFEIHNSEIKPASVIHLQLNDAATNRKPVNWLRACLSGSQAELIIHSSKVLLAITPANFINFKGIKLDGTDIAQYQLPIVTHSPKEAEFDAAKIPETKDFLRHYVKNPTAKLPDFTVLGRFLPVPELYTYSIMVMQHAVKNHGAVPTGIMIECMVDYLEKNPDTKESLITSCLLSSLKLEIGHLKHLGSAKLVKVMDVTQNSSTSTYITRLINNILSKELKPNPELKVTLQQIIDKDEDSTKTKNCRFFLSKVAPDEEFLSSLDSGSSNEEFLDPRFNSEDLKGESKSLEILLSEIAGLNSYDHTKVASLHKAYNRVIESYLHDSKLVPQGVEIKSWDEAKIKTWAEGVKTLGVWGNKNSIPEILSVIKRANILYCHQDPREVQMLSLLTFAESAERGMLAQIATGEGKSTITAMLAVIKALQGHKVDIVTSSSLLAKRDALEKSRFFQMFGLTVGHNCDQNQGNSQGPRICYEKDIVYGDISGFQYDTLRHHHQQKGTRGDRGYEVVIVDEVDSMMIDENAKIAMLSNHTPASEYLEPLLGIIASELARFNQHVVYSRTHESYVYINGAFSYDGQTAQVTLLNANGEIYSHIDDMAKFRFEHLKSYVTKIIEEDLIPIPLHLKKVASGQVESWIRSAVTASGFIEKKDYLVLRDDKGNEAIAPIDFNNTGLIHAKTTWTNGLHQLLQIKHGLKLTPENLITSYISNLSYLKLYGKSIYGMSGTLGSEDAKEILREVYDVDFTYMPTYKPKRFEELSATLAGGNEEWLSSIVKSALKQSSAGRASLIICESIKNVELIEEALASRGYPKNRIRVYSRSDTAENRAVDEAVDIGDIIIATNLAGRGTDLKTTRALEENGGLHVCITFLPSNLRVEQQAFGRTSRQGNGGTGEIICNTIEVNNMLGISEGDERPFLDINSYKHLRNQKEQSKLRNIRLYDAERIVLEDLLFNSFSNLMHELKAQEDSRSKLAQLEENWGIFLKNIKQDIAARKKVAISAKDHSPKTVDAFNTEAKTKAFEAFTAFKSRMQKEYNSGYQIIRNPAHLVLEGFNNMPTGQYAKSAELFALAAKLDDNFSSPAHYNAAYAIIRGKVGNYKQEAFTNLELTKRDIEQILIPNLELLQVTSVTKQDSALAKQIVKKIELLKLQLKYIEQSQAKIANCEGGNEIEISESKLLKDFFDSGNSPNDEILELNLFGIHNLFDVKEVEPPTDNFAAIFMAIASVVQIGVGFTLAASGNIALGASLIIEGLKDSMQAIEMADGKQIKWDNYFTNKGISLAVAVIAKGAENLITKLTTVPVSAVVAKEAIKEAVKESAKTVILSEAAKKAANQELVKATLKEIVKRVVVNTTINKIADQAAGNILAEFKDEIKDKVESKIENCLSQQQVHDHLMHLMEMDDFNGDRENYQKIFKAALSTLERKESLLTGLIKSVISQMASSSSAHSGVKAVASLMQVAEIARALHDITNLTDELQEKLTSTITGLNQKTGDLASIMQNKIAVIDNTRAKEIVTDLERQGYARNNRIIKIQNIEQASFGNNNHLKEYIIKNTKKLYESQHKDYSQTQAKITQDLTAYVSKAMMGTIRSEIMMPAASSPLAKLSQMVTDGIAKTAAEFASVIRTEGLIMKNANQIREGRRLEAQGFGVAAGDEEGGGYRGNKLAGNKGKEKNPLMGSGSNNNNNSKEWQNPDEALMHLMTDPAKLTALRKQREGERQVQREDINPETAGYLKSVLYMGGGSSGGVAASTADVLSLKDRAAVQGQARQSIPEMAVKALVTGLIENADVAKPIAVAALTEDMLIAQTFSIGKKAQENVNALQEQIRQVEEAPLPSEAIKHALRIHTGLDITPKPETAFDRAVVGTFKTGGSLAPFGGIGGAATRFVAGGAIGGTSSLLQETGMHPIAAEVGAMAGTALAFKGGVTAFNKLGSQYTEKVLESVAKLPHKVHAIETENIAISTIEHKLPTEFKHFDFPITEAVEIPRLGSKKPTTGGKYYQDAISERYGFSEVKNYRTSLDGKQLKGSADHIIMEEGRKIAIEAKYVDNWAESIRNPVYTSNKPWLATGGEQEMIEQARKYSSHFHEFRYHTNSPELAEHYTKVFNAEGIKNFKFIITPAVKK